MRIPIRRTTRDGETGPAWEPYADGTMGQQGDASADAEPERRTSIPLAYGHVADAGPRGATSREIEQATGRGHGAVSSALSNLHRAGTIARLKARRDRYSIYVLPEHVHGRETSPYNRNRPPSDGAAADLFRSMAAQAPQSGDRHGPDCWKVHARCALLEAARIAGGRR